MKSISIGIVDDHQIVIDGLLSLLHDAPQFKIVFSTTQPENVLQLLGKHKIQLLLIDVQMPILPGNELAKLVREKYPDIKIMALSMSGLGATVEEMINDADISGYVLKNIGKMELITAMEKIAGGGIYFSEAVLEELRLAGNRKKVKDEAHLSVREIEILKLIEQEWTNKAIAESLFISERTVETHRKNIFRKTGCNNVLGLVKWAYEHKVIG
ncbi:MAG: response regulator transcription factor [Chitinophagaceae bacterium]